MTVHCLMYTSLAGLDFVRQMTVPKGVFTEDVNVSMYDPPSPRKQFKSCVAANDIICRPDLQLLIENQENLPICVKPRSASNLLRQDRSDPTNYK